MTMFGRALALAPLVGALVLAGCGGGDSSTMQNKQAGFAVGEPDPSGGSIISPAVTAQFIKMAQEQNCSDVKNHLFVIDGKQMFWDVAGKCADASYTRVLFGSSPQQTLCSVSDSIAGPRTLCADDKSRELFDTIQKNLDKADLGLTGHKVERVAFLPKAGTEIPFQLLAADTMSSVSEARQVVIKDAVSFAKLWAEHTSQIPAPIPFVDFDRQMVLAVFAGQKPNPCYDLEVNNVASAGDKMVVEYAVTQRQAYPACAQVVTTPMQMIVVERSEAPVEFVQTSDSRVPFSTISLTNNSHVTEARKVVIKDLESWTKLWIEHAAAEAPVPPVNFSQQMVIGIFLGNQPGGCYSTRINSVGKSGNTLAVYHLDRMPAAGVMCTAQVVTPAHLIVVDRTDGEVQFTTVAIPVM
ncbi:protease complex subunit PrcB family protein [Massilia horti]|uniref:PrcB C-terminal domain-containing protein n=1 Tax=Massilia horti TaxID=2562153 RepID=A0A4Y9SQ00_9BURK|nr:protease complex subunit PrcB family protein [Massilia horti]TFW27314.1 hypothetical protein E4O92_24315 [Massilia horti]